MDEINNGIDETLQDFTSTSELTEGDYFEALARAEKAEQLYQNTKIRAEKAENLYKSTQHTHQEPSRESSDSVELQELKISLQEIQQKLKSSEAERAVEELYQKQEINIPRNTLLKYLEVNHSIGKQLSVQEAIQELGVTAVQKQTLDDTQATSATGQRETTQQDIVNEIIGGI
jgi:hypothetical protein